MTKRLFGFVTAAALAAGLLSHAATAQQSIRVGVLNCNVASGWGFIFGSTHDLNCVFSGNSRRIEHYVGQIRKFGVDVGYQTGGVIAWAVVAPTAEIGRGALAGTYGGVTAGAAVGAGLGANALVGGFQRSIALQPLSVEGMAGLNVAAGIAEIVLTPAP